MILVFSDGKEVVFTANKDKMLAISTNNDVWTIDLDPVLQGGSPTFM
ncbi:MAG: hypothetical protein IPJ75_09625 [Ignavibacteriales bacterium]|nr:hypothetical protein [Ignavibacteriales bacterium]